MKFIFGHEEFHQCSYFDYIFHICEICLNSLDKGTTYFIHSFNQVLYNTYNVAPAINHTTVDYNIDNEFVTGRNYIEEYFSIIENRTDNNMK